MPHPSARALAWPALAGSGGLALAAALWFAAPERELPPLPAALPGRLPAGTIAPAGAEPRRRTGACDGAEQATVSGSRPLTPPQSWFTSDDYPALSLMAGHTGTATTELVVDMHGAVVGCGLAGSSGHTMLDTRTCIIFRRRARFAPAEDARGCPVASVWHKRVRWVIGRQS